MTRAFTPTQTTGDWLHPADVDPAANGRLFLFHHSGGNVSMYRDWLALLPSDVAGQCIQLPGRQGRRQETPVTEFEPLVDALTRALAAELDDRPYALFGHSMGALLAYRVALEMERRGSPGPALVAASGWAPVGFNMTTRAFLRDHSDEKVVEAMCVLGSLAPELRADRELLALAVRVMRADSAACASYRDDGAVIRAPIVSYCGRYDPLVAPGAMHSWASRTAEYLGNRIFPGGHFFIHKESVAITSDLVQLLRRFAVAD